MKTLFVVFVKTKEEDPVIMSMKKHYCFNTKEDIQKGDFILTSNYKDYLWIDRVEDPYEFYNPITGAVSQEASDGFYPIRELVVGNINKINCQIEDK